MADDAQFDPFAGILTPQTLAVQRQNALQGQLNNASSSGDGLTYAARGAGAMLGAGLGQTLGGNGPQDQLAAQNQQAIQQAMQSTPNTGDFYNDHAAQYDALAKQFLATGNTSAASRFVNAAQILREEGAKNEASKAELEMSRTNTFLKQQGGATQLVPVEQTTDKNGVPSLRQVGDSLDVLDEQGKPKTGIADLRAKALADAKASGAKNPVLMPLSDFQNSPMNLAAIKANTAIQNANTKADTAYGVAEIRAKQAADAAEAKTFTPQEGLLQGALAERGVSIPTGFRSIQQQKSLFSGLIARNPDKTPDEIADLVRTGQLDFSGAKRSTGQMATLAASADIQSRKLELDFGQLEPLVAKLPNAPAKVNAALTGLKNDLSFSGDKDSAKLVLYLREAATEYAKLSSGSTGSASPGETSIKESVAIMEKAYSEGGYQGLKEAILQSAQNKRQSVHEGLQFAATRGAAVGNVQAPPTGKAQQIGGAPAAGAPQEGATSVSKSGKPTIFKNGHWQYQ